MVSHPGIENMIHVQISKVFFKFSYYHWSEHVSKLIILINHNELNQTSWVCSYMLCLICALSDLCSNMLCLCSYMLFNLCSLWIMFKHALLMFIHALFNLCSLWLMLIHALLMFIHALFNLCILWLIFIHALPMFIIICSDYVYSYILVMFIYALTLYVHTNSA